MLGTDTAESATPTVRLCDVILSEAITAHATGIRFEPPEQTVAFEIESSWRTVMKLPGPAYSACVNRIKIMADLDMARKAEQRGAMLLRHRDGLFSANVLLTTHRLTSTVKCNSQSFWQAFAQHMSEPHDPFVAPARASGGHDAPRQLIPSRQAHTRVAANRNDLPGNHHRPAPAVRPSSALLLGIWFLIGCTTWKPLALDRTSAPDLPYALRITLDDSSRFTMLSPSIRHDTLFGRSGLEPIAVPVDRILQLERESFSATRTAGALLAIPATVFVVYLIQCRDQRCQAQPL